MALLLATQLLTPYLVSCIFPNVAIPMENVFLHDRIEFIFTNIYVCAAVYLFLSNYIILYRLRYGGSPFMFLHHLMFRLWEIQNI